VPSLVWACPSEAACPDCGPESHVASPVAELTVGIVSTRDAIAAVAALLIVFSILVGSAAENRTAETFQTATELHLGKIYKVAATWLPSLILF
jgi:hypothetical protein